jgi:hypothetical protein
LMFKHEVAGLKERITVTHRGCSARVTVTLAGAGIRPGFRVDIGTDPGMVCAHGSPWSYLSHDGQTVAFCVRYGSNRSGALPALYLDAPREWAVTWETLVPHPVLEAARERKRLERSAT